MCCTRQFYFSIFPSEAPKGCAGCERVNPMSWECYSCFQNGLLHALEIGLFDGLRFHILSTVGVRVRHGASSGYEPPKIEMRRCRRLRLRVRCLFFTLNGYFRPCTSSPAGVRADASWRDESCGHKLQGMGTHCVYFHPLTTSATSLGADAS